MINKTGAGEKSPIGLADVGSFAIQQHNNNANVLLENVKVLKSKERIVTLRLLIATPSGCIGNTEGLTKPHGHGP
ncbi:hypothetical protein KIW84_UN0804 [Lathyrus oleraceus]|nr:hypothetical protein KIW84_UN0804 [Pisum sativum]